MRQFKITCRPVVKFEELDHDDQVEFNNLMKKHVIGAENEDEALDTFHNQQPVAVLEDWDIRVREVTDDWTNIHPKMGWIKVHPIATRGGWVRGWRKVRGIKPLSGNFLIHAHGLLDFIVKPSEVEDWAEEKPC